MVEDHPSEAKRMNFYGAALRLQEGDFDDDAVRLGCEVAAIKAVAEVESGGGFLTDKRPKILFESRWFHKLTGGRFDASHPHISTPTWVRNYTGGAGEYTRLEEAMDLDFEAALKSASWGMFQILGVNHLAAGFYTVQSYVEAQLPSENNHLEAFTSFVLSNHLDDELRDKRWADFARSYNGPAYAQNKYDTKMAAAYAKHSGSPVPSTMDVQRALVAVGANLALDGITGPKTRNALRDVQRDAGLPVTGKADKATLEVLGL